MYDFYCPCGGQIHFSACFEEREQAYIALDLLGWSQKKGQWLCPDCAHKTPPIDQ